MPSILKTKERRVLRYLNKYGFTKIRLTARVAGSLASIAEEVVELEQHFIDSLNPNLNVDLVARKNKIYSLIIRRQSRGIN